MTGVRAKGVTRAGVIMGLDLKVCSPAWKTCMRTGQVRPRPTPNTHLISTRSGYQRRRRSLVVTYDMGPGSGKPRRGAGDGWLQAGFQPAAGGPTVNDGRQAPLKYSSSHVCSLSLERPGSLRWHPGNLRAVARSHTFSSHLLSCVLTVHTHIG